MDEARPVEGEERLEAEAGVPLATVGVEDPEGRPPAGWAGAVAGDHHLRGLADHVPPKADPHFPGKLQADPRPLPDRGGHGGHEPGWLQDEKRDPCPPGQGSETAEAVREPGRTFQPGRQVHDEEVHSPAGQERARDREPLLRARGREHHQPFQLHPTGDRLHRIERHREVQPGDDGPAGLRLRGEPEGERGPPAREVPAEREAHPAREPARPQDGVQLREPGREDAVRIRGAGNLPPELLLAPRGPRRRPCEPSVRGCQREGAHHLPAGARRGRSPARSKGREGRRHIRGKSRHQTGIIEHLFE